MRSLEGNAWAATEPRLKGLRATAAGPRPGQSWAVLDPATLLLRASFRCADGHAQERSWLGPGLERLPPGERYIDDRHCCTGGFLWGTDPRDAFLITRPHQLSLARGSLGRWQKAGPTDKGAPLAERKVPIWDPEGHPRILRPIRVRWAEPTRDGDAVIYRLTNWPRRIRAGPIAARYLKRWTVETVFQILTPHLRCEINPLGYPAAARFSFGRAGVAYHRLATGRAARRSVHGADTMEPEGSSYYLAEDRAATDRGLLRCRPPKLWTRFHSMTVGERARGLPAWARQVPLEQ